MATVRDILAEKGSAVHSISGLAWVLDAALLMNEHKIGSLVVMEEGRLAGIITERDVLQRVVASRRDPSLVKVAQVMTSNVACCALDTSVDQARSIMKNRRIRHLPVIDANRQLAGVVSIGDLNAWQLDNQEVTIHWLEEYLYGHT